MFKHLTIFTSIFFSLLICSIYGAQRETIPGSAQSFRSGSNPGAWYFGDAVLGTYLQCPSGGQCVRIAGDNSDLSVDLTSVEYYSVHAEWSMRTQSLDSLTNLNHVKLFYNTKGGTSTEYTNAGFFASDAQATSYSIPLPQADNEDIVGIWFYLLDTVQGAPGAAYINDFKLTGIDPTRTTFNPTLSPTSFPTLQPTVSPTLDPAKSPTEHPSRSPSKNPSKFPSKQPSNFPSKQPSDFPSKQPSNFPSKQPSDFPSKQPTNFPSKYSSNSPSKNPSNSPSKRPTFNPTFEYEYTTKTVRFAATNSDEIYQPHMITNIVIGAFVGCCVCFCICCCLLLLRYINKHFVIKKRHKGSANEMVNIIRMSSAPQVQHVINFERDMVISWLTSTVQLGQYVDAFVNQGYDNMRAIQAIETEQEMRELGITIQGHQTLILYEIKKLRNADFNVVTKAITIGEADMTKPRAPAAQIPLDWRPEWTHNVAYDYNGEQGRNKTLQVQRLDFMRQSSEALYDEVAIVSNISKDTTIGAKGKRSRGSRQDFGKMFAFLGRFSMNANGDAGQVQDTSDEKELEKQKSKSIQKRGYIQWENDITIEGEQNTSNEDGI